MSERIIVLQDEIDKKSTKPVIEQILKLNKEDEEKDKKEKDYKPDPIHLYVNTFGGSVYDGFSLISIIEKSNTPIHTIVSGYAMSMGFLVALSGHKRIATRLSTFMYHDVSGRINGSLEYAKQTTEEWERLRGISNRYIADRTSIIIQKLNDVADRKKEWYIAAEEALELGVIEEII